MRNIHELILLVDFEEKKTFETIEWEFLFIILKRFTFGEDFIRWVKVLYTNMNSIVVNNGYASRFFNLGRGVL